MAATQSIRFSPIQLYLEELLTELSGMSGGEVASYFARKIEQDTELIQLLG